MDLVVNLLQDVKNFLKVARSSKKRVKCIKFFV